MVSIYQLKPRFQQMLKPLMLAAYKSGITPNQLTFAAIGLSAILGACLLTGQKWALWLLPPGLLLRMLLNALDGMLARTYQLQSKKGEVLNEFGDIVSDILLFLPWMQFPGIPVYSVMLFTLMAVLNEFAGLLGKATGGNRTYDGPMGKSDRAFLIGLIALLSVLHPAIWPYIHYVLTAAAVLTGWSTYIRLQKAVAASTRNST